MTHNDLIYKHGDGEIVETGIGKWGDSDIWLFASGSAVVRFFLKGTGWGKQGRVGQTGRGGASGGSRGKMERERGKKERG